MRTLRILPIVAGFLVSLLVVPVALAHAHYVSSNPATGAHLAAAPSSVTITFDDALDPNATIIAVLGPQGQSVNGGKTLVTVEAPKVASVPISSGGSGTYTVKWHSVADDDKGVVEGTFTFSVGAAAAASVPTPAPAASSSASTASGAAVAQPRLPTSGGGGMANTAADVQAGLALVAALVVAIAIAFGLARPQLQD